MKDGQPESMENDFIDIAVDLEWLDSKPREEYSVANVLFPLIQQNFLLASVRTTYAYVGRPPRACCARSIAVSNEQEGFLVRMKIL